MSTKNSVELAAKIDPDITLALKARETLADPKRWFKGWPIELLCEFDGLNLNSWSIPEGETKHCVYGHVLLACGAVPGPFFGRSYKVSNSVFAGTIADRVLEKMGYSPGTVFLFNDHPKTTHEQILAFWDKGIQHMIDNAFSHDPH